MPIRELIADGNEGLPKIESSSREIGGWPSVLVQFSSHERRHVKKIVYGSTIEWLRILIRLGFLTLIMTAD